MHRRSPHVRNMLEGGCSMFQTKMRFASKSLAKAFLLTTNSAFQAKASVFRCRWCEGYHITTMERAKAKEINTTAKSRTTGLKYWRAFETLLKQGNDYQPNARPLRVAYL